MEATLQNFSSAEAEFYIFGSQGRTEVRKRNFTFLEELESRSVERNSCHTMGSQCRAKMRKPNFKSLVVKAVWKRNFRSLALNAERKCGSGTSDL